MLKPAMLAISLATLPAIVQAECLAASAGASCGMELASNAPMGRTLQVAPTTPRFEVGDVLPAGQYYMLMNSSYYGLPPVDGYWRYYRVEGRVLKVHPDTLEVVGDATALTNAAF